MIFFTVMGFTALAVLYMWGAMSVGTAILETTDSVFAATAAVVLILVLPLAIAMQVLA